MGFTKFLTAAALVASVAAQNPPVATYQGDSGSISVNIPSNTASSKSGSIFFQISAPSGLQWLAFGQGNSMSGANMFVVYTDGNGGVTLSPRAGTGNVEPQFDSSIQAKVLSGSGIASDGSMVVNVQCDSCLSWSGGSMDPTSSSSNWIMAYKSGDGLGSTDQSANIQRHDAHNTFTLDLTTATGGSSANPFVADTSSQSASASGSGSSATGSASGSASATATGTAQTSASTTGGVSQPIASSNPGSSSSSSSSSSTVPADNTDSLTTAHGVIMSLLFIGFFPLFALTLYLPTTNKVRFIHAPLQILSVVLLIVGMALGIVVGKRIDELDEYHQIIGYIVVALLVLVQPALGLIQHLHFRKTGGRSIWGPIHQNLGRGTIALGIVNGGLGLHIAGDTVGYAPYAVFAALITLVYIGVVVWCTRRSKNNGGLSIDKENKSPNGYEMNSHRRLGSGNVQEAQVQPKFDNNRL